MNRENEFDLRLARWLEDGPFEAPDRPIEAAIAHARTHPRRRFSSSALWRSAMARMQLTPVAAPAHRYGRALAVGVIAVAVVVIALIGTNVLQVNQPERLPAGVVGPSATATPTPTPTPTPAPVAVTGTASCDLMSQGTSSDVARMRNLVFSCTTGQYSDPRLRGTSTVTANVDVAADDSATMWGTEAVKTAAGSWEGKWTGIIDKGYTTHRMASVLVGSGAYAGLEFRATMTSDDEGLTTKVTGTIEAIPSFKPSAPVTAPIAVSGTENCASNAFMGTTTTVGPVTQVRGQVTTCDEQMSDPRVSAAFESTRHFDYDVQADGTASVWGIGEIPNDGGRWTGVWTETTNKAGDGHIVAAFVGSGGYAGLQYRVTAEVKDSNTVNVTGTISPIP